MVLSSAPFEAVEVGYSRLKGSDYMHKGGGFSNGRVMWIHNEN